MSSENTGTKRVLAIMPHPDDIEILCAGTLIRLREEAGCEIHIATMTAGDKGSAVHSREEIAGIRREEARKASEIIGAVSYRCMEFQDLEIVFDNPTRYAIGGLMRDVNPDIVFTTPPLDYMFDHEITSQLVRDAVFNAGVPNYPAIGDSPATSHTPHLYYSDAIEGVDLFGQQSRVSCRVDISSVIDKKAEALMAHDSQRSWLQKQHGMDNYIESMKKWSGIRGSEIGTAYGEAFSQHLGHPYPHDNLLEQLLSGVTNA